MAKIFTIGTGKRFQYAQADDGYWFQRRKDEKGWGKWLSTFSRERPAMIWYNPAAGLAKLPKEQNANETEDC